jgi:putrescine:ornithine antiporter
MFLSQSGWRGDDDLRRLADRTLSQLYGSAEFSGLYARWFGEFDANAKSFFRLSALPE